MKNQIKLITITTSVLGLLVFYQNCSNSMTPMNLDSQAAAATETLSAEQLGAKATSLLQTKCSTCHNVNMASGGIDYITDINALKYYRLVIAGNASLSPLYTVLNTSPEHLVLLTQNESKIIFNWIDQGLVTQPGGVAPPTPTPAPMIQPTFASISTNILRPKCTVCHNATRMDGGANLSDITGVLAKVVSRNPNASKLYIDIANNSMPKGGTPLTAQQKQAVFDWIMAGAPNN